jgi:hypothetical protein
MDTQHNSLNPFGGILNILLLELLIAYSIMGTSYYTKARNYLMLTERG